MKAWYFSKTIWFNVVMTAVGVATALQGSLPKYAAVLGAIVVVGNVILRVWFTNTAIGTPPPPAV
jgi:hypothetical protein